MALTSLNNGVREELSAAEEAAIRAAWDDAAADPGPVPPEATVLQLYDEMDQTYGIDLEDAVAARGQKPLKRFRIANVIRRSDPMVADLQANLAWIDAQVDTFFRAAAAR